MAGSGDTLARGVADRRATITATEQFNGVFGVADIVISYRNVNDQVLRRPLIVAEGFDPGWITSPEEPEGENSFQGFVNSVVRSGSNNLRNLVTNNPSQYDLVYVNWRNGTDFLQRNAIVLEEVIREVNRLKQPDLVTGLINPNVVLGSSMGGVIARMALGRMDRGGGQNGAGGFAAHQTNLYVSLDAPHQGANVPLGYQAAARHAARMYVSTGGLSVAVETIQLLRNGPSPLLNLFLADQPAARQMLINRIDINYNQNNVTNQQFLEELRTQWAYPANIRNIAISNGSECAIDQEFAAGSSLLYHYRSTKTRFIGDLIFMAAGAGLAYLNTPALLTIPLILPGSSKFELTIDIKSIANGGGNAVYYGNIKLTKKVLWLVPVSINIANKTYNAPTGILPFDTYPGGFYTLFLDNQPGSVSQDWMFSYNNSFFIQRRFSFIPTTSSLDIGLGNTALTHTNYLERYVGASPPAAPFNTPFANFTTAFNEDGSDWNFDNNNFRRINNEPHEGFFVRTANWLAEELNGIAGTSCVGVCNNLSIFGNNSFCTTSTAYSIPDLPAGATVTWSATPSGAVGLSCNPCSAVTLTKNYDATVNLTATITNACGAPVVINKSNVVAGFPFYAGPTGADTAWPNGNYYYYAHLPLGYPLATDYSWTVPSGWSILSGQGTNTLYVRTGTTGGAVEVDITACDISRPTYKYVEIGSGTWWPDSGGDVYMLQNTRLSPNPTDNFVTISIRRNNKLINTGKETGASFNAVAIYDITGMIKKRLQYATGTKQAQINVSALRPGTYIVEITNGKVVERQQLIIQKH